MRLKFASEEEKIRHQIRWITLFLTRPSDHARAIYRDEAACVSRLTKARWPDGPTCPDCSCRMVTLITTRDRWQCSKCRLQFNVRTDTALHHSKLGVGSWFEAADFIIRRHASLGYSEHVAAHDLADHCGIQYVTARRLRAAIIADLSSAGGGLIAKAISSEVPILPDSIAPNSPDHLYWLNRLIPL